MTEHKTVDGLTIRIYQEYTNMLPLFYCTSCDLEKYYFGEPVCSDCMRICRCCHKNIFPDQVSVKVLQKSTKILDLQYCRYICLLCFSKWQKGNARQTIQAKKEKWQWFAFNKKTPR